METVLASILVMVYMIVLVADFLCKPNERVTIYMVLVIPFLWGARFGCGEETYFNKVAAQKPAAAATAASLEQEKANAAASCHKSDVEERVYGTNHATHDLLTGISNFDSSQRIVVLHPIKLPPPPVLNIKMFVNERKQGTTQDACRAIDAAAQSSAISLSEPLTEKIVVATDRKNAATLNNTDIFEDHPSVSKESGTSQMDRPLLKSKLSTDQEVLQPKISRKPATPSFRSSSYGTKQSKIPLSSANYASMHPRKENMLTPITKNSTALDSIDKRRAAQISLYTLMNSGSVKAACKSNSAASHKIESTVATPSAHSTHKRCARPTKTPSKITNRVNNEPMATPSKVLLVNYKKATYKQPVATHSKAANGVTKTSETPSVKRRMETPVHPSAEKAEKEFRRLRQSFCFKARPQPSFYKERASPKSPLEKAANGVNKTSETPSVNRSSKSLSAYKNKLQSPTIPSPFIFITEERAARRKQASKLEEKFNEKDAQKVQLQTTLKEKAEFRRQRQSFCFKARPLPNFYNERATPKSPLKKVDEETSCRAESLSQVSHDSYQKNRMKILKKRPIEIQLRASLFMKRENPNEAINVESANGMYDQKFMEQVDNKSLIGWKTDRFCLEVLNCTVAFVRETRKENSSEICGKENKHLYETRNKKSRIVFLNPAHLQSSLCLEDRGLVVALTRKTLLIHQNKSFFLLPYHQEGHSTLLIIDHSMKKGYILDSYNKDVKKKKIRGDFVVVNVLKEACQVNLAWTFPKCDQQKYTWEMRLLFP
ncbi:WVD2-like protein 7 [Tanacetum coccineum]